MDNSTQKISQTNAELPLKARIILSHAHLQNLADECSVDLLHIKGYAFGADTYPQNRTSTDVDVLVRPEHVDIFVNRVLATGWQIVTHFETGSDYHHAMTIYHPSWGLADIHRQFPGLGKDPLVAFNKLWEQRRSKLLAHFPCWTTSLVDSRLLVYIHSARSTSNVKSDVEYLNSLLSEKEFCALMSRVKELDAEVAFAAATGNIEDFTGHPDYLLWKTASEKSAPTTRWYARLKATPGARAKIHLLQNIVLVNRDHLAMELGRQPSRSDVIHKFFSRFWEPAAQIFSRKNR